jgi:hypothetical protein
VKVVKTIAGDRVLLVAKSRDTGPRNTNSTSETRSMTNRRGSYIQLESDGATLQLIMGVGDDRVTMPLGAAEAVGLATELLQEARKRLGRGNWPPMIVASTSE